MILGKMLQVQRCLAQITPPARWFHIFKQNTAIYGFRSDPLNKNSKPLFKKQPIESKPVQSSKPTSNSTQKPKSRLFKRMNIEPKPISQQPAQKFIPQIQSPINSSISSQIPPLPNQTPQKHSKRFSSHNLHECQLILNNFKDIIKQSKSVPDIIKNFLKYKLKLNDFSIKESELKDKYMPIMYAAVMRAFSRILRREVFLERAHFIKFLGNEYEQLEALDISCLNTLELSDFVQFFNLFEISMKFSTFSEGKLRVVDKFLKEIHNRYTQQQISKQSQFSSSETAAYAQSRQHSIDQQKLAKRRLSQLIMVSRTAQIFNSPFYYKFLLILIKNLNEQDLNSYKITAILRFILRPQCISNIHKQAQILDKILAKMDNLQMFKEFAFFNIKQLYVNLCSIVDNNQYVLDMAKAKQTIIKIQDYILSVLPELQSDEIYQVAFYSIRRGDITKRNLARELLKLTFSQISPNGETNLNPLFVIQMFSVNSNEEINFSQIDPLWEEKFLNMFNRYLLDTQPQTGLRFCSQYIENIYFKTQSQKIKQTIINSFLSIQKKLVIPYNNESYMLETHFFHQRDMSKKLASLHRLKNVRARLQKSKGFLQKVFDTLESQNFDNETKLKVLEENKEYINSVEESRINRHGYMKILSRYCQQLGHEELIDEIFFQSLVYMIENRAEFVKQSNWSPKINFDTYTDFSQLDLSQILDQKCRDKVCALFHTFIVISFELKIKLTRVETSVSDWQKIESSRFLKLIKKHDLIAEMFMEVLCRKQTGVAILMNKEPSQTQFLIKLLRYFSLGPEVKPKKGQSIKQTKNNADYEKYYYAYYQILKIYPLESLKAILSIKEGKQAIKKILQTKKTNQKLISSKSNETTTETIRSDFLYDKDTGDVIIDPRHAKVLKLRVDKCLDSKKSDNKKREK